VTIIDHPCKQLCGLDGLHQEEFGWCHMHISTPTHSSDHRHTPGNRDVEECSSWGTTHCAPNREVGFGSVQPSNRTSWPWALTQECRVTPCSRCMNTASFLGESLSGSFLFRWLIPCQVIASTEEKDGIWCQAKSVSSVKWGQ
jgi:hypothetical protein